ncbi:MAG: zinc-ribbon domain containing protein [Planctomycetaceae bacterium]|nr:zinc-ribbon domain containing protein [Planctomycetaceae bacterium]
MSRKSDKYESFVDHPRYGRRPHLTGRDPSPAEPGIHLHWNATTYAEVIGRYQLVTGKRWPYGNANAYWKETRRIPNTAVPADLSRQSPATVAVTHYFDLERECRDCRRPFIFFALEQKFWYEQLGFPLESDCVRCFECRRKQQGLAQQREVYELLFHVRDKTDQQTLDMADACLNLIEHKVFSSRQTERVRMLLNSIPVDSETRQEKRYLELIDRVLEIEERG